MADEQSTESSAIESTLSEDEVQLRTMSYAGMLRGCTIFSVSMVTGLVLLGKGERGDFGSAPYIVLPVRLAAWMFLFVWPVQNISLHDIRTSCLWGVKPWSSALRTPPVHWFTRCATLLKTYASTGHVNRQVVSLILIHGVAFFANLVLLCCFSIPQMGFMGYCTAYVLSCVANIIAGKMVVPRLAPCLNEMYGMLSGPGLLGPATLGFFISSTVIALCERVFGSMLSSGLMIALLATYESVGISAVSAFYVKAFLRNPDARRAYCGTGQALMPSVVIAIVACMCEGARVSLLVVAATVRPTESAHVMSISLTLVNNLLLRTGCMDHLYSTVFSSAVPNSRLLLRALRFQAGYPRFFALGACGLARFMLGTPVAPNRTVIDVVLLLLLESLVEDVLVALAKRCGCVIEPSRVNATRIAWSYAEEETPVSPSGEVAVVPAPGRRPKADVRAQDAAHVFEHTMSDFPVLPPWGHFAVASITMFHTYLLLVLFAGGVYATLGFCDDVYTGVGRGIIFWELPGPSGVCV